MWGWEEQAQRFWSNEVPRTPAFTCHPIADLHLYFTLSLGYLSNYSVIFLKTLFQAGRRGPIHKAYWHFPLSIFMDLEVTLLMSPHNGFPVYLMWFTSFSCLLLVQQRTQKGQKRSLSWSLVDGSFQGKPE
jgi:hypothetical protein